MKKLTFSEFMKNLDFFAQEARNWKIFIYPTDTIYGIWSIWNEENVKRIAKIKKRNRNKIFSVIAPNFEWIFEKYKEQINSINSSSNSLSILNWNKISEELLKNQLISYHWITRIFDYNKPGVRILKHDVQKFVEKLWDAFITTSVNISWKKAITDLTKSGREIITSTFATFEVWLVVAAMYLLVTSLLSQVVFYMERRLAVSD